MELRDVLKMIRGELGMNQSELANALHVSYTSVNRWEAGKTYPNRSILSALSDYALSKQLSAECIKQLNSAITDARKAKIAPVKNSLFSVEHASLGQLIDEASFPIYVCDLKTDELLYLNHKTEALLGGSAEQLVGQKCYKQLMHRNSPCPFCHKEKLCCDSFTTFQAFSPKDNDYHLVQAKLIQWNGKSAHVRYIIDRNSTLDATTRSGREASYAEQLQLRRELAGDAIAVACFNLTHNTVSDIVSGRKSYEQYMSTHTLDELLSHFTGMAFSGKDQETFLEACDRRSMIQLFYAGKTHITFRHYVDSETGVFESVFDLMQNPVTYDIEAFAQLHDITDAAMLEEVSQRLFNIDYETIITIDAVTGAAHPYLGSHIGDILTEQKNVGSNTFGVESYLRKHCADDDVESVITGTSLPYVKEQLEEKPYYHITYSLKHDAKIVYKRAVYSYLDSKKSLILCAMQDLTDLHETENAKRDQLSDALRALQEHAGIDTARYDLATRTFYSNSAMATAVGYGDVIKNVPDEFIDNGFVAPDFAEGYREFYEELRRGKSGSIVTPCRVADGSFHWLRVSGRPLFDRNGEPYQALMLFKDIDEEREKGAVYAKWRQSLEQREHDSYTLFRCNLTQGASFDRMEGGLLDYRFKPEYSTFNSRTMEYASRRVHIDDFDAYVKLLNSENLLASYYRGTRKAELGYRESVSSDEYRDLHVTVEMAQYPDSTDIEIFILYEPCADPGKAAQSAVSMGRAMFDNTGVVLVSCDWQTGVFDYDPSISRHILGHYDDRPIWEVFMEEGVADTQDIKVLRELMRELAETPERNNGTLDIMLKIPSGTRHWFMVNVYKRKGRQNGDTKIVLAILDTNEDTQKNKKLRFQAEHDELTELYNRQAFLKLVTEAVREKPADTYLLLCSDINDFGLFNDRYGHEEGDRLLQFTAQRLHSYADANNGFAGRLSNDVFAILLPNTPGILERAEGIIRGYFNGYPLKAKITGRAGVCVISDPSMKADTMLDRAATAKDSIRGKYGAWLAVYDDRMNEQHLREKYVTDRMESALAEGQFDVHIQPQFNHGTGQIVGAEALVRWNDPERGTVSPGEFIPIFEKNGFITRMDEYVWDKTAQYVEAWMKNGNTPVPISVNVSREDTKDPYLCDKLLAIMYKYNIPKQIFRLEITESLFAEDPKRLAAVVEQLHKAGFLIEMDDFGSGYSSLNILKDVPVDILKLDMKFFTGDDNPGRGGMIINSVLRMSRWLGIPVIAEGVELQSQADFLLSIGCSTVQGYLYSRPLPVQEFEGQLVKAGWDRAIPQNTISTELKSHSFWNPLSTDSQLFQNYIGPAFMFEYHDGEYEIIRMNKRFINLMQLSEAVMLPAKGLIHFLPDETPKVKKAVLEALYTNEDTRVDLHFLRDDGSTPLFSITLRVIAKSGDRALLFAELSV